VTFDIDHNGIVSASARDLATGREQQITITASTNLSAAEVDRLVAEAAGAAQEDRRRRQMAEVRNAAEGLIFRARRLLESGEVADERERAAISDSTIELQVFLEHGDLEALQGSMQRLEMLLPAGVEALSVGRLDDSSSSRYSGTQH
jgi:molecular chaperone DnaK